MDFQIFLIVQLMLNKLEDEKELYLNENYDLKSSLSSVKNKLERREDDLSKLTEKLVELEEEIESKLDRKEKQDEEDNSGYYAMSYSNNSMEFNIHRHNTEIHKPIFQSKSLQHFVVKEENDKIINKIAEIRNIITEFSEQSTNEKLAIRKIFEEHDNEILKLLNMSENIENKINIFRNDLSQINVNQEEHEILLKELVTETQDNHKSIIMLTKIFEASRNAIVNSVVSQRSNIQHENGHISTSPEGKDNQVRQSCLDISDYNGLDDIEDNGILEIQSCNSITSEDHVENEEIKASLNEHDDFKEAIEDRFGQILEVNKPLDINQEKTILKSTIERSNTGGLKKECNKTIGRSTYLKPSSMKNANNFLFNAKSVTRSSLMMKSIIEDRKIRNTKVDASPETKNKSSTDISSFEPQESNISELERLKKEYFKITAMIISIQKRINRASFNTELLWINAKENIDINNYHSHLLNELTKNHESNQSSLNSSDQLSSEEIINLSDLMQLKIDIYHRIILSQNKDKESSKVGESNKNNSVCSQLCNNKINKKILLDNVLQELLKNNSCRIIYILKT